MTLDDIRRRINMIDFEILKLLNSRMEFALRTRRFKREVDDPRREHEVIEYIEKHSRGLIEPEFCKQLFQQIIAESKRLQQTEIALMAFQGEHGAFSEVAARRFNPELLYISCAEYGEVFRGVEARLFHFGIVPVESTLGGTFTEVNEFLIRADLKIVGEVRLPVHYHLLTLPETDPTEIRVVYSHRQTLSHCRRFIQERRLETRLYYDMAAAAKMLVQERPEGSAVIASEFCANFYNLQIVASNIEDVPGHVTRYVVVARPETAPPKDQGNKCSIVFVAEHRAGALFRILEEFADRGLNLTRIESMPNRLDPLNYIFFLDFYGSDQDPEVVEVLERVRQKTSMFRFLGCYYSPDGEAASSTTESDPSE